jgi:uncharacterized protein YdaU (DUF1376 family)
LQYFSHHIGDFIRDTAHLSLIEEAVYRRLMDLYYTNEGPLPNDIRQLCRHVRARLPEEVEAVEQILNEFFNRTDDGWRHKRCDREIAAYRSKSEKARASAEQRWRNTERIPERNAHTSNPESERNANGQRTGCERIADAMLTNNQEPITKKKEKNKNASPPARPDWLPEPAWGEWIAFRKRVSGRKFTDRAVELNIGELAKLRGQGFDPCAVIEQSIARGWTGLFPLKPQARASPASLGEAGRATANAAAAWLERSGGENEAGGISP